MGKLILQQQKSQQSSILSFASLESMGPFHLDQTIINSVIATSPQAKPTHQRFFENSPTPQERSPMTANTPEPFPPSEPPSALHSPPQWGGRPASRRLGAPAAGGPSIRTAGRGTGPTRRPCRWAKRNKWIWVRSQRCRHTKMDCSTSCHWVGKVWRAVRPLQNGRCAAFTPRGKTAGAL